MNIGIIGTGSIAEKLASAITNVKGANLFAISSRTLSKAKGFAKKFNVTLWYEGLEDFLENTDIDLVYIATPNSCHYKNTIAALKKNKAVLCEKPFALNLTEAKEMIALGEDKKLLLVEAMWTKFFPAVKDVKTILDSGILGEIVTVQGDLSFPLGREKTRLYDKKLGGGALLDLGIYPLTMMHFFLGKPDKITAEAHFTDTMVDSTTSIICTYNTGISAMLSSSIRATKINEFSIFCTNGWIRLNGEFHCPTSISFFAQGQREQHKEYPRKTLGYEYQIESILTDFNSGKFESSVVKHKDTLEIMGMLDIIRKKIGLNF